MPNHCNNKLRVEGTPYHIRNFARDHYRIPDGWGEDRFVKTTLDFSASVPLPTDRTLTTFNDVGYDWQIANWGTKWNAYEVYPSTFPLVLEEVEDKGDLTFSFETAWSPPIEWLIQMSEKYPALTFSLMYDEPGMAFCGWLVAREGRWEQNALDSYPDSLLSPDELKLLDDDETWEDGWEILHTKVRKFLEEIPYEDLTFPGSGV